MIRLKKKISKYLRHQTRIKLYLLNNYLFFVNQLPDQEIKKKMESDH